MVAPSKSFTVIADSAIDPDSPLTSGLFTNLRDNDIHLEEWLGDGFTAAKDHDHDGVNSKLVPGNDFILIEKKLVTADVTDVDFTGLDGDTDEIYRILGRIVVVGLEDITLQPNNITTNQASRFLQSGGSGTSADLLLANSEDGFDRLRTFDATFWAKKNPNGVAVNRVLHSFYTILAAATTQANSPGFNGAVWNETTTNVTSLRIHAATASGIKNGSTIALYKLRQ